MPGPDVLDPVGQGVAELQVGRGPGLLHVVAGDGDGVELGHLGRGVGEDVRDDPHGGRGRIDVGVADHELFEHVVLDGAGELGRRHPLLLGGQDVQGQHRQHGAVHGHGHRHLVERDAVEELAHVQDRVDGHAGHADVAGHPRVVAVVAAVGGQVEGHRQALLPGGQVAPVEGVGLLGRGETGVLADGPRLVDVHGRIGAAQERHHARVAVQEVQAVQRSSVRTRRQRRCPRASPSRGPTAAARIAGRRRLRSRSMPRLRTGVRPVERERRRSSGIVRSAISSTPSHRDASQRVEHVAADADESIGAGLLRVEARSAVSRPATYIRSIRTGQRTLDDLHAGFRRSWRPRSTDRPPGPPRRRALTCASRSSPTSRAST